ncbi:acyltransferase family protein [Metabacillus sp. JX24]|uniref:acyltransferase family protein n=1 Tax=Metabacillus sp. JX24 TaxID=3240759 RepID=UPI003510D0BA
MFRQTDNRRYIPALDGLRAIAVMTVIAYHFHLGFAKGGFLGVDVFFVLSGYLITSMILPEKGETLKLNFAAFWTGRLRRLLPAAFVMITATFVWVMFFDRELVGTLRGDAVSSLFYVSNWWYIFNDLSYFDQFGSPSPFKNLWSLAIEEQFYIIWPMLLAAGLFVFKKRLKLAAVIAGLAVCSAVLMAVLFQDGTDPSRVYYGTDTRAFELLTGCVLALVWPMKRLTSGRVPIGHKVSLNVISFAAFGILLACFHFVTEYQAFLYRGGMFLICLNAAVLIGAVSHPVSYLGKILSFKPLRWIGTRSYGIYLWHYPVIVLGTPVHEIGNPVYWRVGLQLLLILVIAELSYRLIEVPVRREGFRGFIKLTWTDFSLSRKAASLVVSVLFVFFAAGALGIVEGEKKEMHSSPKQVKISDKQEKSQNSSPSEKEEPKTEDPSAKEVLAIGDSVMIDIAPKLQEEYPGITIDAEIGRQMRQAVSLAPEYKEYNEQNKAVVIHLGTNGYFPENQLQELLDSFSEADVYLVNTRVPKEWESSVNRLLQEKAAQNENVTLIDWYAESIDHPEYFGDDGVHLGKTGSEALTDLIAESVNKEK